MPDISTRADSKESSALRRWREASYFAAGCALLVAVAIAVLSLDRGYTLREDPQTDNAYVGGDVTQISARVQGYVTTLPIADNQFVHAGDLIATVENDDYRAARDQARAALQAARAALAGIEAQRVELSAEIAQSRTGEQGSIAAAARTGPELARQRILVGTDAGLRRALDEAVAEQKRTEAAVAAAHAQRLVRERQTATLAARQAAAAAQVAARQADLDLAEIDLGWTRILAPVDGTLSQRQIRVGDLLSPGARIIGIAPLDTVWVDANFTERQVTHIRIGQTARLRFDSFPGEILAGKVVGVSPVTGGRLAAVAADNTTGNFTKVPARVPVRIAILWNESGSAARLRGNIRPGMSAVASVATRDTPETPQDAR